MIKKIKDFFFNLTIMSELKKLNIERSQIEHYTGVEKNTDEKLATRYSEIEREINYLVVKIR